MNQSPSLVTMVYRSMKNFLKSQLNTLQVRPRSRISREADS